MSAAEPSFSLNQPGDQGTPPPAAPTIVTPSPAPAAAPTPTWHQQIQDEGLRNHPTIQRFKTPDEIAREVITIQPLIGAQKIPRPPDDPTKWTPEQWNMHYTALGRPGAPEEYGFEAPKDVPEGYQPDVERQGRIAKAMHEAGLSKSAAHRLMAALEHESMTAYQAETEALQANRTATVGALRSEWGLAAPEKLARAREALIRIVGGEQPAEEVMNLPLADKTRLGDNVQFIKLMAAVAEQVAEDGTAIQTGTPGNRFNRTPEEAKAEIVEFRAKHSDALLNPGNPLYSWAHKKLEDLYRQKHPQSGG